MFHSGYQADRDKAEKAGKRAVRSHIVGAGNMVQWLNSYLCIVLGFTHCTPSKRKLHSRTGVVMHAFSSSIVHSFQGRGMQISEGTMVYRVRSRKDRATQRKLPRKANKQTKLHPAG